MKHPDDFGDFTDVGTTLSETKRSLVRLQSDAVAVQVTDHPVLRPRCSRHGGVFRVRDYRERAVATPLGQVTLRLA